MKDRIKLSFADRVTWFWRENENTTICKIRCSINLEDIPYYMMTKLEKMFPEIDITSFDMAFYVKGVAKLNPEDSYDRFFGRHLAETRAKAKAYSIANRVACALYDLIYEDLDRIQAFTVESCDQYEHELDHIDYLIENG